MIVEGKTVPADVLEAEEEAKNYAAPHVNFYDPSVYKVNVSSDATMFVLL